MSSLGVYLIIFAVGSAILEQFDRQFTILQWMNDMGNGAWVVRGIMIVIGLALIAGGQNQNQQATPSR